MQTLSFLSYRNKKICEPSQLEKLLSLFEHNFVLEQEFANEKVSLSRYRSSNNKNFWQQHKQRLFAECEKLQCDVSIVDNSFFETTAKLFVSDMDSTLIQQEVIDEMAAVLGIKDKVSQITKDTMLGTMQFNESIQKRVQLLAGLNQEQLFDLQKRLMLTKGARQLLQTLKKHKIATALISGGFDFFAKNFQKDLGFDYQFSNQLQIQNNIVTGILNGKIIDEQEKQNITLRLSQKLHANKNEMIAVGDGANDIAMIESAGLGISFYGKPPLQEKAFSVIRFGDLSSIIYFANLF